MYPVNNEDSLSKITRYELSRGNNALTIEIFFHLCGHKSGSWEACPVHKDGGFHVSPELWGCGDSEGAALRECLQKIRNLSINEVHDYP